MMSIKDQITARLTETFSPISLTVIDESDKHRGHGGWREGGETHFRVQIVSAAFSGQRALLRHRAVNEALAEFLAGRVHALAIETKAPEDIAPGASIS